MTESELIVLVTSEVKGLATSFTADDYTNALGTAKRETGFAVPNTNDTQIHWLVQRMKRHLFFFLCSENTVKFKIKQINLDQKFTHLRDLIKDMDKEFAEASNDMDFISAGVNPSYLFGHKIDAGFSYDPVTGTDTTYTDDNLVLITPGDITE